MFKMRVASDGEDGYNILKKVDYLGAVHVEPGWLLLALSKTPSYRVCFIPRTGRGISVPFSYPSSIGGGVRKGGGEQRLQQPWTGGSDAKIRENIKKNKKNGGRGRERHVEGWMKEF